MTIMSAAQRPSPPWRSTSSSDGQGLQERHVSALELEELNTTASSYTNEIGS